MTKSLPIGSSLEQLLLQTKRQNDCLIWQRGLTPNGYGKVSYAGKSIGAHRLALFYTSGIWGEVAMHSCDTKACINPEHLSWGSYADNSQDMVNKGRSAKGMAISQSKLTDDQVAEIKKRIGLGESYRSVGRAFGVSKTLIRFIGIGEYWRHINAAD